MDDRRIPIANPIGSGRLPDEATFTVASVELLERAKLLAEDVQDRVRKVLTADNPDDSQGVKDETVSRPEDRPA